MPSTNQTDMFELAQAWLEHCREQAEYFDLEGEDDTAEKWHADAEAAEKAIKRQIDNTDNVIEALATIATNATRRGDTDIAEAVETVIGYVTNS